MDDKQRYSNCFIYAIQQWKRSGGYIVIRKSRFGWWPHFLHARLDSTSSKLEVDHFVPDEPKPPIGWRRWFPIHTIIFKGRVHTTDQPNQDNDSAKTTALSEKACLPSKVRQEFQ